ncbi:MAG TPA: NAD-dependent epimerase/dehydratase family protein [Edaphobacter sp.]|nr:NAD-dependent epimerase/dehydratase family protein [Edaphobacter sp.]
MAQQPLPAADLDHILNETRPLWEEMRNRRIFITGGTGFFGCWLLESFSHINRSLNLNARATVLTRDPAAFEKKCPHLATDPALAFHAGDVRDFSFPDGDFEYTIHAATEASAKQAAEKPLDMLTTIIDGTERVLEFAATGGTRKLLLTSSGAIYGKQPADLTHISEDYLGGPDPLDRVSVYAEGKRISEQMCALQSMNNAIDIKIARCFAFVGPHLPLDAHFAIGNFIGDVLAGRPIKISGDGTARRSYLYASDLAIWLWTMLFRAPSLVAINVGSAEDLSIFEVAQAVVQSLGAASEIHVAKSSASGVPVARYVPLVDRAKTMLGLNQTVSLQEAVRRTAQWHVRGNGV